MNAVLKAAEVVPLPPDADIVGHLEQYLADAKEGRFVAIGIAAVTVDNRGHTSVSANRRSVHLLGAIEVMKHRLLMDLAE